MRLLCIDRHICFDLSMTKVKIFSDNFRHPCNLGTCSNAFSHACSMALRITMLVCPPLSMKFGTDIQDAHCMNLSGQLYWAAGMAVDSLSGWNMYFTNITLTVCKSCYKCELSRLEFKCFLRRMQINCSWMQKQQHRIQPHISHMSPLDRATV